MVIVKVLKWLVGIFIGFLIFFPFYWVIISSFKTSSQILQPDIWPRIWTLEHYQELFTLTSYPSNLFNSAIVALGTMAVTILIVIPASYAIYRMNFYGKNFLTKLLLATYIFPGILLLVPVYSLMSKIDLINNYWSLIIMNVTFAGPFSIWLMKGFYEAIPNTLDEAAGLDGASSMQILFRIILPLIRPGLATIIIYSFISSWTEFTFASILVTDDRFKTLPVGLHAIMGQYTIRWGWTTAAAVLTLLPVVIIFAFIGKFFIKGLTEGAVKA
jgi:multiple sugar transport system permease protein